MASHNVQLYIYDLSQGLAAKISPMLLGNLFKKYYKFREYLSYFYLLMYFIFVNRKAD